MPFPLCLHTRQAEASTSGISTARLGEMSSRRLCRWELFSLTEQVRYAMKDFVEFVAKGLVDKPEDVQVVEVEGEQGAVLELRVAKEDLGKVIGKQGRTARALRTLLGAASSKAHRRVMLEIVE